MIIFTDYNGGVNAVFDNKDAFYKDFFPKYVTAMTTIMEEPPRKGEDYGIAFTDTINPDFDAWWNSSN